MCTIFWCLKYLAYKYLDPEFKELISTAWGFTKPKKLLNLGKNSIRWFRVQGQSLEVPGDWGSSVEDKAARQHYVDPLPLMNSPPPGKGMR